MDYIFIFIVLPILAAVICVVVGEKLGIKNSEIGCLAWIFVLYGLLQLTVSISKFNPAAWFSNIQRDWNNAITAVSQLFGSIFSAIYTFIVINQIWFCFLAVCIALPIIWVKYRTRIINQKNQEIDQFNTEIQKLIDKLDKQWESWDDGGFRNVRR